MHNHTFRKNWQKAYIAFSLITVAFVLSTFVLSLADGIWGELFRKPVGDAQAVNAGDFNNDGKVDVFDLGLFSECWGKRVTASDPLLAKCNLNDIDTIIDVRDLGIFASTYGNMYTPLPDVTFSPTPTPFGDDPSPTPTPTPTPTVFNVPTATPSPTTIVPPSPTLEPTPTVVEPVCQGVTETIGTNTPIDSNGDSNDLTVLPAGMYRYRIQNTLTGQIVAGPHRINSFGMHTMPDIAYQAQVSSLSGNREIWSSTGCEFSHPLGAGL